MYKDWRKDLKWSARAFSELVWPELNRIIGGDLIHVESITEISFARDLDQLSGIDAWHIVKGKAIRGIASRVQECLPKWKTYDTFTVRKSRQYSQNATEYEKRKDAIYSNRGWLYPHLTVQAYVSSKTNGYLRSFAVAETKNIIDFIDSGKSKTKPCANAVFYVIPWDKIICSFICGEPICNSKKKKVF